MRVLIVTDRMGLGGAETHIYTLISELRRRNIPVALLSGGGVFADRLSSEGVTCYSAPLDKRDPISVIRSAVTLGKLMKTHEIIHTHTRFTSYLAMKIRAGATFPVIICTAHLCFPLTALTRGVRWGDGTLAVSEDIKRYLIESYKVSEENVTLTRNGIDTEHFDGVREEERLIVHTSRLDSDRCATAFLLAKIAPLIHERFPDVKLSIVGDGEKYSELRDACEKANKSVGRTVISAEGGTPDVKAALARGQIFVGVSRAALEAMAMGLPTVICGNEGYAGIATPDKLDALISTNFCARGEPSATVEALLRDICVLLENENLRRELSVFSRSTIIRYFPSSRIALDALRVYRKHCKPMKLCLLGYFGFSNLGDEEILKSARLTLKTLGISNISVLRKSPADIENAEYDRSSIREIHRAIATSDALVLCGGNLLQNETSIRSLIYYFALIRYARLIKKRIYVLSSGLGDIRGPIASQLVKESLKGASFIGARTEEDRRLFSLFTDGANIATMPDFCFLLPKKAHTGRDIYFAVIAARGEFIRAIDTEKIKRETGLTPIGIIICKPLDEKRVIDVYSELEIDTYAPNDFEELSEFLTKCAFSVCERLHGAIFSVISRTPAYLTQKSSKCRAFTEELKKRAGALGTERIVLPICESIKKIGVKDSDFDLVINAIREDIYNSLYTVFGGFSEF